MVIAHVGGKDFARLHTISGKDVTVVRLHYGAPRPLPRVASNRGASLRLAMPAVVPAYVGAKISPAKLKRS